jgi:methionyl-tRNA synthetase
MIAAGTASAASETFFLTGTDEHGQKVLEAATQPGQTPQEFTDRLVASEWLPVLDVIDASNDDFIRTTDARHTERVREFWQTLNDNGHVYEGTYEGSTASPARSSSCPAS